LAKSSSEKLEEICDICEKRPPEEIIRWAIETYSPKIGISCSFGKDSAIVLDIARRIKPDIPVIHINTGLEFPETLKYRDRLVEEWGLNLWEYTPKKRYEELVAEYGEGIHEKNPKLCCEILKVEPIKRALEGLDAWITGLRRDETDYRKNIRIVEDYGHIVKINPLANWTEEDVWRYLRENNVPYNPLYDQGYRSLGCKPCTNNGNWGMFERAGRWSGTDKEGGECGIHTFMAPCVKPDKTCSVKRAIDPGDGSDAK
jgi:phosphoadenosine phosphosulfate reductase